MEGRETGYERLMDRLAVVRDLRSARSLLFWDQQTYMPAGGVAGRAEQMATLSRLGHEMLADADRKSTRLNSSHANISYAVFCLKKKKKRMNLCHDNIY